MPWDSVDKPRDEDLTARRKRSRRRFNIGGRRKTDNQKLDRPAKSRYTVPMKIWLDDIRDAPDETWKVIRLPQDAVKQLILASVLEVPVEVMSFDHDLGENLPTGYEVLNWIEEWAAAGKWDQIPATFQIHSANPVGRKNMQAAIDSIERMRNG